MFQSAPLTEARGDVRYGRILRVSIRSPHRSKGRLQPPRAHDVLVVSIRSPHRSKGRPAISAASMVSSVVSIRSPHRSKGRPPFYGSTWPGSCWFQSAPLTEARGDREVMPDRSIEQFQSAPLTEARGDGTTHPPRNPLPSPKQGETISEIVQWRFNPLPSPKQGETLFGLS